MDGDTVVVKIDPRTVRAAGSYFGTAGGHCPSRDWIGVVYLDMQPEASTSLQPSRKEDTEEAGHHKRDPASQAEMKEQESHSSDRAENAD